MQARVAGRTVMQDGVIRAVSGALDQNKQLIIPIPQDAIEEFRKLATVEHEHHDMNAWYWLAKSHGAYMPFFRAVLDAGCVPTTAALSVEPDKAQDPHGNAWSWLAVGSKNRGIFRRLIELNCVPSQLSDETWETLLNVHCGDISYIVKGLVENNVLPPKCFKYHLYHRICELPADEVWKLLSPCMSQNNIGTNKLCEYFWTKRGVRDTTENSPAKTVKLIQAKLKSLTLSDTLCKELGLSIREACQNEPSLFAHFQVPLHLYSKEQVFRAIHLVENVEERKRLLSLCINRSSGHPLALFFWKPRNAFFGHLFHSAPSVQDGHSVVSLMARYLNSLSASGDVQAAASNGASSATIGLRNS